MMLPLREFLVLKGGDTLPGTEISCETHEVILEAIDISGPLKIVKVTSNDGKTCAMSPSIILPVGTSLTIAGDKIWLRDQPSNGKATVGADGIVFE